MAGYDCTLLKKVDFGQLDGATDPNLEKYFFDDDYWDNIIEKDYFFVVGRKGAGKSAIYRWLELQSYEHGALFANLEFNEFPFQKLLSLADDNFARPNQYQSIWKYMILTEIAKLIVNDSMADQNEYFNLLKSYVKFVFGDSIVDLHKRVTEVACKNSATVSLPNFPIEGTTEKGITRSYETEPYDNIVSINRRLQEVIMNYLKSYTGTSLFVVQFDKLDDNYNTYTDKNIYFQAIISLFKVIYSMNQAFLTARVPTKVIAYIRSDIFYRIDQYDAESARWDEHRFDLNWAVIDVGDYQNGKLRKMISKRILASHPYLSVDPWDSIINPYDFRGNTFEYIVKRTLHKPREVIQFCKKLQQTVRSGDVLSKELIFSAERDYSLWFKQELTNEIGNEIQNVQAVFDVLRSMGSRDFTLQAFSTVYEKTGLEPDAKELLSILYRAGIISNVRSENNETRFYSVLRNEQSSFNSRMNIVLHPGLRLGLHV